MRDYDRKAFLLLSFFFLTITLLWSSISLGFRMDNNTVASGGRTCDKDGAAYWPNRWLPAGGKWLRPDWPSRWQLSYIVLSTEQIHIKPIRLGICMYKHLISCFIYWIITFIGPSISRKKCLWRAHNSSSTYKNSHDINRFGNSLTTVFDFFSYDLSIG